MIEVFTTSIYLHTRGNTQLIDITEQVSDCIVKNNFKEGQLTVFSVGSTTGVSTVEFEPGLVQYDVCQMFEKISPYHEDYRHNETWNDDNGASHLRSTLMKTSLVVPFNNQKLFLGTWQQIVFIDFDTRERNRQIVIQIIGIK